MIIGLNPPMPTPDIQPQALRPVGSIIKLYVPTNPASLMGFGVWERISQGRIAVSLNETDPDFSVVGGIGGEKAHVLIPEESGRHSHNASCQMAAHTHGSGTISAETVSGHTHTITSNKGTTEVTVQGASGPPYIEKSGSSKTLSAGDHTHNLSGDIGSASVSVVGTTSQAGNSQPDAHNNMPPYMSVYIWKRTS